LIWKINQGNLILYTLAVRNIAVMLYANQHAEFMTGTCLEWKPLIESDSSKEIIIDSLRFLSRESRVCINGFVLMSNHFHLIWQVMGDYERKNVQRDFMKYTAQKILDKLIKADSPIVKQLHVQAADRKYQFWERNSLSISLTTERFMLQKLNYIHNNPVRAGLCRYPEDYRYSSARFYLWNERDWDFLVHYKG
jgi:putative transposase